MNCSNLLANKIVDVSRELSKEFPATYLQLTETPLRNLDRETTVTNAEYKDYLESIQLQLLELRHTE